MTKLDLVRSYWRAEKERDMEAILGHFAPDARFVSPTMSLNGRDEIRTYYAGIQDAFKDVDVSVVRAVEEGDLLAVEWLCRLVGNDGRVREVEGCNVFVIARGQFEELRVYFNAPDFD